MTFPLLISFRETLEAALIIGVILSSLQRMRYRNMVRWVWLGVAAGVLTSLGAAIALHEALETMEGPLEALAEGITMLIASALVGWMVTWMVRQGTQHASIVEQRVESHASAGYALGIFGVSFLSVVREGIEIVILLQATLLQSASYLAPAGAALGIALAISVSFIISRGARRLPLKILFSLSTAFLLVLAVSLFLQGMYEIIESGYVVHIIESARL